MGITVEHGCPQCGAPIELDELDHLLRCPYCNVKSFLFTPGYSRLVLPHKAPDKEIIHVPYLRFKGNVYFCKDKTVGYRFIDITRPGIPLKAIPPSLGVRPQAMKMRFVTPDTRGSFLRFSLKATDILTDAGRLAGDLASGRILHRAYIGETLSLIYLPLYVKQNRIVDAVLNRPVTVLPDDQDIFQQTTGSRSRWGPRFMATLCPQCGWSLEGERDSVVLICSNCDTVWQASKGRFTEVKYSVIEGRKADTTYLPFWSILADTRGVEINSYADFLRVTNQPAVIQSDWESREMRFWSPAFKIRPKIFLRLSRQLTCLSRHAGAEGGLAKKNLYPVTLPQAEAAQSMKLTLASSAIAKEDVFPFLPRIRFTVKDSTLVYLPFTDTGHDMVQQDTLISINKNALAFGRGL